MGEGGTTARAAGTDVMTSSALLFGETRLAAGCRGRRAGPASLALASVCVSYGRDGKLSKLWSSERSRRAGEGFEAAVRKLEARLIGLEDERYPPPARDINMFSSRAMLSPAGRQHQRGDYPAVRAARAGPSRSALLSSRDGDMRTATESALETLESTLVSIKTTRALENSLGMPVMVGHRTDAGMRASTAVSARLHACKAAEPTIASRPRRSLETG